MDSNDSINPYAPTNSPNLPHDPADGAKAPDYKLYSMRAILLATFLSSFLGGGIVLAINLFRLGRRGAAWAVIVAAAICTAINLAIIFLIPDDLHLPNVVYCIPQLLLMYFAAKSLVGNAIEQHERLRGQLASTWGAAGIGLVTMVLLLVAIFGGALLYSSDLLGPSVAFADGSEVYYSGDATEADARELGNSLEKSGYFGNNQSTTVLIRKSQGVFTVSFVVKPGVWDDPAMVTAFEEIAKGLSADYFPRPLHLELCDEFCKSHKTLTIQ